MEKIREVIAYKNYFVDFLSDIWRVFCFFDIGKLVILLNGFQKKTQKTPKKEIDKAIILMNEYYESRK